MGPKRFQERNPLQIQSYQSGTSTQAAKAEARCPHGSTPGACPACSGGGGGGGGGGKTSGLMGWNEAYAVWNAIRMAETRQKDYLQGVAFQQQRQQQTQMQAILNLAQAVWTNLTRGLPPALINLPIIAANTFRAGLEWVSNVPKNLVNFIQQRMTQGMQPLMQVVDRLVAMLGDAQRRLDDILHHNGEMLKSLLAQFQWENLMGQVQHLVGGALGAFAPQKVFRSIERRVKNVLGKMMGLFGQTSEDPPEEPEEKTNLFRF